MSRFISVPSCILLLLAGCAATPYQAADPHGYGYAEEKDAGDIYTVTFVANTATSEQQTEDFALLRAAELGMSLGFAYIKVVDSKSGIITLGNQGSGYGGSGVPTATPSNVGATTGGGGSGGMSMQRGRGGGYGGTGSGGSYTFGSSSGSGSSARAAFVKVRFFTQVPAAAVDAAQQIASVVARIRAGYALPVPAPKPE